MKYPSAFASALLATACVTTLSINAKPIYSIQNLGSLGGDSTAISLNDMGQVVGNYQDGMGNSIAFVWDSTNGMQSLGTLGGNNSFARDINNLGQIVGNSDTGLAEQVSGFVYQNGTMSQIIDLTPTVAGNKKDSEAGAINDDGLIVGSYVETTFDDVSGFDVSVAGETFLKDGDSIEFSGRLPGDSGESSSVLRVGTNAINNNGEYVGTAFTEDLVENTVTNSAFIKARGEDMQDIGTLGGFVAFGFDINDEGTVVGRSRLEDPTLGYHAFIHTETFGMVDMNDVFGFQESNLRNINNNNIALGWGSNSFQGEEFPDFAPFLFDVNNNQTFMLNDLLTVDSEFASLDFAYSLNENNDIVGYGTTKSGEQRAFLMNFQGQIPEPSTIALLIGGFALLLTRRKIN